MDYYLQFILPYIPDEWLTIAHVCRAGSEAVKCATLTVNMQHVKSLTAFEQMYDRYKHKYNIVSVKHYSLLKMPKHAQMYLLKYNVRYLPDYPNIGALAHDCIHLGESDNVYIYAASTNITIHVPSPIINLYIYMPADGCAYIKKIWNIKNNIYNYCMVRYETLTGLAIPNFKSLPCGCMSIFNVLKK